MIFIIILVSVQCSDQCKLAAWCWYYVPRIDSISTDLYYTTITTIANILKHEIRRLNKIKCIHYQVSTYLGIYFWFLHSLSNTCSCLCRVKITWHNISCCDWGHNIQKITRRNLQNHAPEKYNNISQMILTEAECNRSTKTWQECLGEANVNMLTVA